MTGSCSACAQSAKVRESESGVNQPPAPSTNTSRRDLPAHAARWRARPRRSAALRRALMMCGRSARRRYRGSPVVTQRDPTMMLQRQRIFITQPIAGKLATGGHRLIAGSVKTQQISRLQQGAAGDGFTDFSIGPGDKKRLVTLNDSCKKRIRQRADALPLRRASCSSRSLPRPSGAAVRPRCKWVAPMPFSERIALSASANGRLI